MGGIVYFVGNSELSFVKIGKSTSDAFISRMSGLQCGNPYKLHIFAVITTGKTNQALKVEKRFHSLFQDFRIRGEWFHLTKDIIDALDSIIEDSFDNDFMLNIKESCPCCDFVNMTYLDEAESRKEEEAAAIETADLIRAMQSFGESLKRA